MASDNRDSREIRTTLIAALIGAIAAVVAAWIGVQTGEIRGQQHAAATATIQQATNVAIAIQVTPLSVTRVIEITQITLATTTSIPEPTSTPTSTVAPTSTATASISLVTPTSTITSQITPIAPSSTVVTVPLLTPTLPSTERLEVTHPLTMSVEANDVVTTEIIPDPKFATIGIYPAYKTGVIRIERSSQDGERSRYEETVRLYPVMSAELIASNFEVKNSESTNRRRIGTDQPASWTWNISATKTGVQRITINVFGEDAINTEKFTFLERSISRNIYVSERPTVRKIADNLIDNFTTIIGTGGPLGLIIRHYQDWYEME